MKTKYIIETAEELLSFANPHRIKGDDRPFLNFHDGVKLVIENKFGYLLLQGAPEFELSNEISFIELLHEMAELSHLTIEIT